jgi:two-component system, cell cycle sensor histidine kinase and response regulator CckA
MPKYPKSGKFKSAREKFLGLSLESTRKSYYPQLQAQLDVVGENERRLRLLADNLPAQISYVDSKKCYQFVNRQYEKVFGLRREQMIGRPVEEVFGHDNYKKLAHQIDEALCGKRVRYETSFIGPEGKSRWLEINYVPDIGPHGEINGFYVLTLDVTEKKLAEEEREALQARLQRAEKMETVGTLAGGVAHDLNNILSGLVSYPDLLLMDLPDDSPLRKVILTIKESGERAAAIVQDLLTLARRGVSISEVINLNDIVTKYLKTPEYERLKAFYSDTQIETDLQGDLLNVLGSPIHLAKIIMNLVSNAVESQGAGGTVTISTRNRYLDGPIKGYDEVREGDYVVLTVSDNGIGISDKDLKKIFEPFYTKKVMGRSGTGLGMSVVWGAVKDHNGYINVESIQGKGSTFTVYFPITRREADKHESSSIEAYAGNGEKILVVDDIPQQGEIASVLLSKLGYSVDVVSSGEEAIEYMKANSPDLLILDMIMDPGIDGLDTYEKILEKHPGQKAIITSGYSETDRVEEAQKLGAGQYVRKPYTLKKIGLAVKAELSKKDVKKMGERLEI